MQESLEASLVRIRTADGRVVGAGFLVGEHHILTCAHVVSVAVASPPPTCTRLGSPSRSRSSIVLCMAIQRLVMVAASGLGT